MYMDSDIVIKFFFVLSNPPVFFLQIWVCMWVVFIFDVPLYVFILVDVIVFLVRN